MDDWVVKKLTKEGNGEAQHSMMDCYLFLERLPLLSGDWIDSRGPSQAKEVCDVVKDQKKESSSVSGPQRRSNTQQDAYQTAEAAE